MGDNNRFEIVYNIVCSIQLIYRDNFVSNELEIAII